MRELELPREALVNVIVRDGHAIPPRGSTELREGDELHILVRGDLRDEVERQTERWTKGPIGKPPPPPLPRRAASQVFSVRPLRAGEDPETPTEIDGIPVVALLRSRRDDVGTDGRPGRRPLRGDERASSSPSAAAAPWRAGARAAPNSSTSTPRPRPGSRRSPAR